MSLRHVSRVVYQTGMRVMQGIKDQAPKCGDATVKSMRDSGCCCSSSKQALRFSASIDSGAAAKSDKLKQAEESLRTVMYLSCWAPN